MVVEIEKSSVSFTDEAHRSLQTSLARLERRIRAKAADEAIKSRGTPTEVTGSDIEKAYRMIVGLTPSGLFDERMQDEHNHWRKAALLRLTSTVYTGFGIFLAIGGIVYPFIRSQLLNPSQRLSVMIAASGVLLAAVGMSMRSYLRYREFRRRENILVRRYPRSSELD